MQLDKNQLQRRCVRLPELRNILNEGSTNSGGAGGGNGHASDVSKRSETDTSFQQQRCTDKF